MLPKKIQEQIHQVEKEASLKILVEKAIVSCLIYEMTLSVIIVIKGAHQEVL